MFKIKLLMLKNSVFRETEHSKLKLYTVLCFTVTLLLGEFFLFFYLFSFLGNIQGIGMVIIEKLFYLFFMAIFFLLIFSNIIVSYSTIFNSNEISIFLSYPVKYIDIFDIKFLESVFFSSWAFVFIIFPFITAFGIYKSLPASFYLISIIYIIPFILISGVLGNFITICFGKLFIKRWFKILLIFLFIIVIPALIIYGKKNLSISRFESEDIAFMLSNLIPHFKISQFLFLPSYWLSKSLLSFSWQAYNDSFFYFAFALSNSFLAILILRYLAQRVYYDTWESIKSTQTIIRKNIQAKFSKIIDLVLNKIVPKNNAFINKDIKLFMREPTQWGQGLMFFGLLAVYFGNLENLSYNLAAGYWKNAIVFLNMMATSLTLASLCVRFVFPQLSLEGNKAWLLKLAPVSFKKILLGKFWVSFLVAIIITESLIFLSNYMLEVEKIIFILSSGIIFMICFALVGLSCGLGAIFPNFKQDNPAVIVSGLGGTLNFIFSLIYLGLVIWILAPYVYAYIIDQDMVLSNIFVKFSILGGSVFILSCLTGILPIYLGIRSLERMEF